MPNPVFVLKEENRRGEKMNQEEGKNVGLQVIDFLTNLDHFLTYEI